MEGFVMPKCTVYTGELKPRAVQALRRAGYFCVLIPTPGAKNELCILRDIDGSKIIACFADAPAGNAPEPYFSAIAGDLVDLPIRQIEGAPDDSALTYPEDGVLHASADLYVNADNVGLKQMTVGETAVLELYETAGRETAYELYCEAYDFCLRALFQPYETKRFTVDGDRKVTENDFD